MPVPPLAPPPQLVNAALTISSTMKPSSSRSFFLRELPSIGPANTIPISGKYSAYSGTVCDALGRAEATAAVVVTARVTVWLFAPGMMLAGENVQLASVGNPEQARVTEFGKDPPTGENVSGKDAVWPAVTVWEAALELTAKSMITNGTD